MNTEMFYRGVLNELTKRANTTVNPAPRKKSLFANPLFWGGLGLAGLGGYGLWRGMRSPAPAPAAPTPAPAPTPAIVPTQAPAQPQPQMPDIPEMNSVEKAENVIDRATLAGFKGSLAAPVAGWAAGKMNMPGTSKFLGGAGSVLGRGVNVGTGLSTAVDAFNPDLHYSENQFIDKGLRGVQAAGGLTDIAASTLSPQMLARGLAAAAPGAVEAGAANAAGNTLASGGRTAGLAGALAAFTLAQTGNMAQNHSLGITDMRGGPETLYKLHNWANSPDPQINHAARLKLYEIFNDSKATDQINEMTNPGGWTRMGYNPTPAGPFYDERLNPQFGGIESLINRIRRTDMPSQLDQYKFNLDAIRNNANTALQNARSSSTAHNPVPNF